MKGNLYAMIASQSSRSYTEVALDTFRKNTILSPYDELLLIDNDNEGTFHLENVKKNTIPLSFAKNVNEMIDYAQGRTLFLLSNDIAFTPNWNIPLTQYKNILLIPSCNQTHVYKIDDWEIKPSMQLTEINNKFQYLNRAALAHQKYHSKSFFERLLMGFYGFVLPASIYENIGYFDERFGLGGGEDVDYRIRCIKKNIPVKYLYQSYLLHFSGKSTWDGPEQQKEIEQRNQKYFSIFSQKWGEDLANLCLVGGNPTSIIEKYKLHDQIQSQDFSGAFSTILNIANRE